MTNLGERKRKEKRRKQSKGPKRVSYVIQRFFKSIHYNRMRISLFRENRRSVRSKTSEIGQQASLQNLFINFRMNENLCLNFIIKLSSWLLFFTYLGDEESSRKRKKRKKRKVHRMTEGTLKKFQFIQFLTIYKRKTLRHTSLRLSRDMRLCSFCSSNNRSCFTIRN